jgi:hypothetical protein
MIEMLEINIYQALFVIQKIKKNGEMICAE